MMKDVVRKFNKFDVYICDLGPCNEGGNLGKKRPCVIVQSDEMNDLKNYRYMVAPMRTEHNFDLKEDNLNEVVDHYLSMGRNYVPIEYYENDFRIIDISQMQPVVLSNIYEYCGTIVNQDVIDKIDAAIFKQLFGKKKLDKHNKEIQSNNQAINVQLIDKLSEVKKHTNTDQFFKTCAAIKQGTISKENAAKLFGMTLPALELLLDDYSKYVGGKESKATKSHGGGKYLMDLDEFKPFFDKYMSKEMSVSEISDKTGITTGTIYSYIRKLKQPSMVK